MASDKIIVHNGVLDGRITNRVNVFRHLGKCEPSLFFACAEMRKALLFKTLVELKLKSGLRWVTFSLVL